MAIASHLPSRSSHSVLETPELLEAIIGYLARHECVRPACVNQFWFAIAVGKIWRHVNGINHILELLAPMSLDDLSGELIFNRPLSSIDWRRFDIYAPHVWHLISHSSDGCVPHASVFHEIARIQRQRILFPNLVVLEWHQGLYLGWAIPFMGPRVHSFSVMLHEGERQTSIFPVIANCMPDLEGLRIIPSNPFHGIETRITKLIGCFPKLKTIALPPFCLTPSVFWTLSCLDHLDSIELDLESVAEGHTADVTADFSLSFRERSFPSLKDLEISLPFASALSLFNQIYQPRNLVRLLVESAQFETSATIHELCKVVANNLPSLESLTLYPDFGDPPDPVQSDDGGISLRTISPIIELPHLRVLDIDHHLPFNLSVADADFIARKLPRLERLLLGCCAAAVRQDKPGLSFASLLSFARHCPCLEDLGLFLDDSVDFPSFRTVEVPFRRLVNFSPGVSRIGDPAPVAQFLSKILPSDCNIVCMTPEDQGGLDWSHTHPIVQSWNNWHEVKHLLPFFSGVTVEERAKLKRKLDTGGASAKTEEKHIIK